MNSKIRIHRPDCCHGWGIEFNYEEQFWEADADDFVTNVLSTLKDAGYEIKSKWFHQCGSGDVKNGKYFGYQFFECFSEDAHFASKMLATVVAGKIGTTVTEEKE